MSKTAPWALDTDAYLADTGHLRGATQHGAYLLILMAMWRSKDGTLAGDDASLAAVTRLTLDKWRRIAPVICALLKKDSDGRVTQKRIRRDKAGTPSRNPSRDSGTASKPLKNQDPTTDPAQPGDSPTSLILISESINESPSRKRKSAQAPLPEDGKPGDAERLYGRTAVHLTDAQIDDAGEQMRRWALNNAHRSVGRKPRWDLAFRNWLDRFAAEHKPGRRPGNAPAGRNGGLNLTKRYLEQEMEDTYGPAPSGDDGSGTLSPEAHRRS